MSALVQNEYFPTGIVSAEKNPLLSYFAPYLESFTDDHMEVFVDGADLTRDDAIVSGVEVPDLSST